MTLGGRHHSKREWSQDSEYLARLVAACTESVTWSLCTMYSIYGTMPPLPPPPSPGDVLSVRKWRVLAWLKCGRAPHLAQSWSESAHTHTHTQRPTVCYGLSPDLVLFTSCSVCLCASSDDDEVVKRRAEARLMAELAAQGSSGHGGSSDEEGEGGGKRRHKSRKSKHKKR